MPNVPDWTLAASVAVLDLVLPVFARPPSVAADAEREAEWRDTWRRLNADTRAAARASTLAEDLADIVDGYGAAADDARAAYVGLQRAVNAVRAYQPATATTGSLALQRANEIALTALIEHLAIAAQARALARMTLASYDEAARYRAAIVQTCDTAIDRVSDAGNADMVRVLRNLLAVVVRDLIERGRPLARLANYETGAPLPAAVLAHALYYDAGRADDLARQNAAPHPAFMPLAGKALSQ